MELRDRFFRFLPVLYALFAYNEVPAFAVAKECWLRARRSSDAPFFLVPSV
jgi:hypothetical protein